MLGQIRTIRETFPALIADIRLGAHVHVHMRRQSCLHCETLATLGTDVLFRPSMGSLMVLELLFRHKTLSTVWEVALVWFVARVAVDVAGQFRLVAE